MRETHYRPPINARGINAAIMGLCVFDPRLAWLPLGGPPSFPNLSVHLQYRARSDSRVIPGDSALVFPFVLRLTAPGSRMSWIAGSAPKSPLPHADIEQGQPILDGLERETDQNQSNAKDPHAFFGHVIGGPLDEWRAGAGDRRDHADGESAFSPTAIACSRWCATRLSTAVTP